MSKLSKLYAMISNAQELGIDLGDDVYKQTDALEEKIIKEEILPIIKEKIEPTLSQIKRDIVLVVDYVPNEPVSVRISRKGHVYKAEDFVEIKIDPPAVHNTRTGSSVSHAPRTGLRVIRKDGSVIHEKYAGDTLVSAIKEAGAARVRSLGIICCKVPLVSTTIDKKYGNTQVEVAPGLYVIKHSNNTMKKGYLEKISKAFGLGWKVVIIE